MAVRNSYVDGMASVCSFASFWCCARKYVLHDLVSRKHILRNEMMND